MGGRGRAHSREDRNVVLSLIDQAVAEGARQSEASRLLGLSDRTVQRWRRDPEGEDARQGPSTPPNHKLDENERARLLEVANRPEFCDRSPHQIVCKLADDGHYEASESTFYRVLRANGQQKHRQPSKPPTPRERPELVATKPGQIWVWDITYLPTSIRGQFAYLYLVMDLFSRKIVGWAIHDEESSDNASRLISRTVMAENACATGLTIHADNGAPMKGSTLAATLQRLEVATSFSRPGVSNDNAHCESGFRTLKYRPGYPKTPLADAAAWTRWVTGFVTWYNTEHCHSGIGWVTPEQRHDARDVGLLEKRRAVYAEARQRNPRRWSRHHRPWSRPETVHLTPSRQVMK